MGSRVIVAEHTHPSPTGQLRHIRLGDRLVHVRLPLVDYVVAHELAHLGHMDHSPRFWRAVASVYPDFAAARRELRSRSRTLPQI